MTLKRSLLDHFQRFLLISIQKFIKTPPKNLTIFGQKRAKITRRGLLVISLIPRIFLFLLFLALGNQKDRFSLLESDTFLEACIPLLLPGELPHEPRPEVVAAVARLGAVVSVGGD